VRKLRNEKMQPTELGSVNWVDAALVGAMMLSVVIGALRGFVYEILSWVGWGVAYGVARFAGPNLAPMLPLGQAGSRLNLSASMAACFLVTLFTWSVLNWTLRRLMQASPLRPLDRTLGGLFGVLRGLLIGLGVAFLVQLTSLAQAPVWAHSIVARELVGAVNQISNALPAHNSPARQLNQSNPSNQSTSSMPSH
jgi:membrane protein required for colicin V production